MSDPTLSELTQQLLAFRDARNWKQFHNPKDQALSLSLEAAELLEHMQWRDGEALQKHLVSNHDAVGQELADVLGWVLLIAHDLQIDLGEAFSAKQKINNSKYPVDKSFGKATKYNEL